MNNLLKYLSPTSISNKYPNLLHLLSLITNTVKVERLRSIFSYPQISTYTLFVTTVVSVAVKVEVYEFETNVLRLPIFTVFVINLFGART